MKLHSLLTLTVVFVGGVLRAADTTTVTGTVSNLATGNLLEGARVEIPALGVSALTGSIAATSALRFTRWRRSASPRST